jgi:hypothetical protein
LLQLGHHSGSHVRGRVPKRPGTIEQGKNFSVREVPGTGKKIGHDVDDTGEVRYCRMVAMEALVQRLELKEIGGRTGRGYGLAALSRKGWCVVAARVNGALGHVTVCDVALVLEDSCG